MGALVEYKRGIKKEKCRDLLKSATTKIKKLKSVIEIVEEKELSEKEKALIFKNPNPPLPTPRYLGPRSSIWLLIAF